MDQRERFEAEYCKKYGEQPLYRRDMKGSTRFSEYFNHFIQSQWETWQAAEAAALERAAHVCASYSVDKWNLYKGRAPYDGSESGRANSYVEGQSDGAEECAAAIHKLAAPVERGGDKS